jgi:hypothetical protein
MDEKKTFVKVEAVKPTSEEIQFTMAAIKALPQEGRKGIHSVWSQYNEVFKGKFPGRNPIAVTNGMKEMGLIDIRPWTGGVLIFKKGDMNSQKLEEAKAKIEAELKGSHVLRKNVVKSEVVKLVDPKIVKINGLEDILNG